VIKPRFSNPSSDRRRLLIRIVAGTAAAAIFGVLSMTGAAAPGGSGGGGGGKPKRDTAPPSITASIVQQTSSAVVLSGTASDNVGVTEVDVAVDRGASTPAQGSTSWSYTIDTTKLATGSHTATATARDAAGNTASASATFSVSAPTPPTTTILSPTANADVGGTITVNGTASGTNQVAKVELKVDGGAYKLVQGTSNWAGAVDVSGYANGTHTLTARATDAVGNVGVSSEPISVENDVAPPTIAVTTPSAGAKVSGTFSVAGTASDDVSVATVAVSVDGGAYAAAQGTTAWTYSLDTTQLANGSHTLTAQATDGTGKTSTSSVTFSVGNPTPASSGQELVTPEGVTIDVAPDVTNWTPQQIYDLLKPNAYELSLIGPDVTIKVQTAAASATSAGAVQVGSTWSDYHATIYLQAIPGSTFSTTPESVLTHEYGHAWTLYHLYMSQNHDWTKYLQARGVYNDPRLNSSYMWSTMEIAAEDYRLLFGTPTAQNGFSQMNYQIPDARDVSGLKSFFTDVWAQ
jgi:hypothetical protein